MLLDGEDLRAVFAQVQSLKKTIASLEATTAARLSCTHLASLEPFHEQNMHADIARTPRTVLACFSVALSVVLAVRPS